ncbi:TPA: AEC family transporter [Klebsiella aerogenes]|uniref:Auxin Efflux Carrier n=1 Tax=Klebsiella aerogenes (strain ATCC 13048 / DSM 30053 / CCUG 1429 / JCM 1235 / KCTC 2190 / NBRC 13534 / NCIMB 10102 / NCTC 10006 / CDC 819-56) TaxID=1028307 RepID=A0A0H3FIV6_KLEAK|nr:AEC family transporter [Klebsiella aerogenes]AEG95283.1 Auxin Efflux Carrier [Klebsiella aerogenes KCTC 2190]KLF32962.1 receptor [Klebsiella aerogenes]MEC4759997.1 AEC family transporter [Klebsiella aerogenes]QEU21789.1 receptor [Klebsiella aerogenes]QXB09100.1 AEC family transporter [Klebsiella aerogenes]
MTQNNILLILGAILPVIITVLIGYISGKRKDFNWQQAGDINKIVMLYALPLSIFSNMVMTPRHIVMSMGPVAIAIILALIPSFLIPLAIARYICKRSLALSTLQALAIGSPAVPFIGTSVLAFLFGTVSASLITVSSITQNVFQLPLVMILMSVATGDKSQNISFATRVINAIKQPVVWSPVVALILVLMDIHIPETVSMSLGLLGKASGGLALFAAGIVLYTRSIVITSATIITVIARNILVPGACYLILLKMGFSMEQIKQVVLTMAIPVGSIAIIIAMQYKSGEQEMASTMALSIITSIITMGAFIFLTF